MKETKQCITIRRLPNPRVNSLSIFRERGHKVLLGWEQKRRKLGFFFFSVWDKNFCYCVFFFTKGVSRGRKTHSSCQRWLISSLTLNTRQCSWYRNHISNGTQCRPQLRKWRCTINRNKCGIRKRFLSFFFSLKNWWKKKVKKMVSLFNNLVRPWFKGSLARLKEQTQFNMLRVLSSELLADALLITITSITNT